MYRKDFEQRLDETEKAYLDVRKLQNRLWDLTNGYKFRFTYQDFGSEEEKKYSYHIVSGGAYFHAWDQMPFAAFERLYYYKEMIGKWLANELADLPPSNMKDSDG